jgi:hypothetical protein
MLVHVNKEREGKALAIMGHPRSIVEGCLSNIECLYSFVVERSDIM